MTPLEPNDVARASGLVPLLVGLVQLSLHGIILGDVELAFNLVSQVTRLAEAVNLASCLARLAGAVYPSIFACLC